MPGDISVSGGDLKTPFGAAPILPLALVGLGGYLMWFGVKYWRNQGESAYPSTPVKSVLQGKGLPAPAPAPSAIDLANRDFQKNSGPGGGALADGSAIAADAMKYVGKVKYVWGGADPKTGWDCSGLVNWVVGHDLDLDIPGEPKGNRFDGAAHGPDVASWLNWSGVKHVSTPQAGDLVAWGPNRHMGVCTSATHCVSAQDPALGTTHTLISATDTGTPAFLRLRAVINSNAKGGSVTQNQKIAKLLAGKYGWSPSQSKAQWDALVKLWERESGWKTDATNPSSGAYGIPQALPASKLATAGKNWKTNASVQVRWGLKYIKQVYGSPEKAWQHEQAVGWY